MSTRVLREWFGEFIARDGRSKLGGRPLFEYRASDAEFEELGQCLRDVFTTTVWRERQHLVGPTFCLWAAEWWTRKFNGGSWSWAPLVEELGKPEFAPGQGEYPYLQELVEKGLRQWERKLKRGERNDRRFLDTIALEGGLPLRLLSGERGEKFKRYLRALLGDLQRYGGHCPATEIAERLAHYLPASFRLREVYELAAELVLKIRDLQKEIGDVSDPVAVLDRQRPAWRQEFPLRVSDDIAVKLLSGLVRAAAEAARIGSGSIAVRRFLRFVPGERRWEATAQLEFPSLVAEEVLTRIFDNASLPTRFQLSLDSSIAGLRAVATGRLRLRAGERYYDLEASRAGLSPLGGEAATVSIALLIRNGPAELRSDAVHGAQRPPEDAPWIFEVPTAQELAAGGPSADPNELEAAAVVAPLRMVGSGSCSIRAPRAVLALPLGFRCEPDAETTWVRLGEVDGIERELYTLGGRVTLFDSENSRFVCRTAANVSESTDGRDFHQEGTRRLFGYENQTVWLGRPELMEIRPDQAGITVRDPVQWRPSHIPGAWRTYDDRCLGDVRIRVVDRNGEVRFSTRTRVFPRTASLRYRPGLQNGSGEIVLCGFNVERALPLDAPTIKVDFESKASGGEQVLRLAATASIPPVLRLALFWPGGCQAELSVSFPAVIARFEDRRGKGLASDTTVSVAMLDHYRAFALSPTPHAHFYVDGDARDHGMDPGVAQTLALHEPLAPDSGANSHCLELSRLRPRVELLLDLAPSVDAACRLRLDGGSGARPPVLYLKRYDISLKPGEIGELGPVLELDEESTQRISGEELRHLAFEAVSLVDPDSERVVLDPFGVGRWWLPESVRNGEPWMVLGWDGGWARVRPRVWAARRVASEDGEKAGGGPPETARAAALLGDLKERKEAFAAIAARMGSAAGGPDWRLFDHHLEIAAQVGPQCLDFVAAVSRVPDAAAYAAVRCRTEADLDRLWRTLEHLPFAWWLIPAGSWERAFGTLAEFYETLGEDGAGLLAEHLERLSGLLGSGDRAPWLLPLVDLAGMQHLERNLSQDTKALCLGRLRPSNIATLGNLKQEFVTRSADATCPGSRKITSLVSRLSTDPRWTAKLRQRAPQEHWQDSLDAPVVAAACAVWGDVHLDEETVGALRRLAAFDPEWFDKAYFEAFQYLCVGPLQRENQ